MHLVICHSKNTHIINKVFLDENKYKLLIFGQKNSEYYKVCKNINFIYNKNKINKYLNNANFVTLIDHVSYVDPKCLKFERLGSFFSANLFGDDELYLMQVMGFAPDELNGTWHDEYINSSNLSSSNIRYEFLERYLYEKNKNIFNFNKYRSVQTRSILITNSTTKLRHCLRKSKNITEIINNFKIKYDPYISANFWYLNHSEENDEISYRLYRSKKH